MATYPTGQLVARHLCVGSSVHYEVFYNGGTKAYDLWRINPRYEFVQDFENEQDAVKAMKVRGA